MNRRIVSLKLLTQCLLLWGLVLQQSCAQHNFNTYDDYDDQGNYNDHHPLDIQPQYGAPQPRYEPHDRYASSGGPMEHQANRYEDPARAEYEDSRVYQPYPEEHTPVPQDPRIYQAYPEEESAPQDRRAYQPYPQEQHQSIPEENIPAPQDPRVYQPYPEQTTPRPQDPRVYQPYPEQTTPRPQDPRVYQPYPEQTTPRPQDPRVYQPYPEQTTPRPQDPRVYQPYPEQATPRPQDPRIYQPYPEEHTPSPQDPRVYQPYPEQPSPSPQDPNVIMVPRLGLVRGQHNFKIIKNRPISAYLGLKYGTVRPGLGRFQKASVPELNRNPLIEATQEPSNCPQFPDLEIIREKERRGENVDDCLTLNVFTPAKSGQYPVIVFVHGEMLFDGSAEEGQPDYFLENDVVLVTINYRLAPFGYLSTLTDDMPGNVALADIQMALEWIQQYIRAFNGNADQVTLLGQAGGATLIHALSLSGKAEGLFHKLILQSGTALNPYFLDELPLGTLRSFAHYARCPPSRTIDGFVSCFERMSTYELLNYFKRYFENNEPRGLAFVNAFKLIVGDKLGYLPQHPASMVANNTKPMIIGVTKDGGAFIMSRFYDQLVQIRSRNITDYINVALKHTTQPRHHLLWKQWALQHIFTPEDATNPSVSSLVQKLLELVNLILYRGPVIDSIRYTSKSYPTYLYCFDYRGEYHRFGHLRNPLPFEIDATLSDDNIFLFPYPTEVSQLNPEDKSMARAMVTMWVNFAQYNVPNFNTGVWPNVSSEYGPFLRFTNTKESKLELDYHFGEGIPVPNLYPEYFTTTTTTTTTTSTTTTTTTPAPPVPRTYPNYPQYSNYNQYPSSHQPQRSPAYSNYRSHENVLSNPNDSENDQLPSSHQNYPTNARYNNYPNMRH